MQSSTDKFCRWSIYEQALPILRKVGDRAGEAVTLNNIGMVYCGWGAEAGAGELRAGVADPAGGGGGRVRR